MQPAADAFAGPSRGPAFVDAAVPVLQNTDPTPSTDAATIRQRPRRADRLARALDRDDGRAARPGVTVLLECGPGAVLTGLAKRVDGLVAYAIEQTDIEDFRREVGA